MAYLSRTDLEQALRFAALAGEQSNAGHLSDGVVVDALWDMIDSEYTSYERIDDARPDWRTQVTLPADLPPEGIDEYFLKLCRSENPFVRYRRGTGNLSAVRREDVVDVAAYRRSEYASLMAEASRRKYGTPRRFILVRWVPTPGPYHGLIYLERTGRNFTLRDRLLLDALAPHLAAYEFRGTGLVQASTDSEQQIVTAREGEVLDLIATGATNAQVGERLWISPETVRTHLEHIYLKLGVNSRTAALARTGRTRPASATLDGRRAG